MTDALLLNKWLALSHAVYGGSLENDIPPGFTQTSIPNCTNASASNNNGEYFKGASGFCGAVYKNDETGEIIIAFRGTERAGLGEFEYLPNGAIPDAIDALADLSFVMGEAPVQYAEAWEFYTQVITYYHNNNINMSKVTITGHSLGGGLAQLVAAKAYQEYGNKHTTYTFNAPGAKAALASIGVSQALNYSFINNYCVLNDWCGMFGQNVGNTHIIPPIQIRSDGMYDTMTNTHEGIFYTNWTAYAKPIGLNQQEALSLWYYDKNNYFRQGIYSLPSPAFTELVARIVAQTSVDALKRGIEIVRQYFPTSRDLIYVTPSATYTICGTDNSVTYTSNKNDVIYGRANDKNTIYAYGGNDTIYGGSLGDEIYGGDGDDYLEGGEGNDFLYGGNNWDVLNGGKGNDYLSGGTGYDTYVINHGDGYDTIVDSDNWGRIVFNGVTLGGAYGLGMCSTRGNWYIWRDGNITYEWNGINGTNLVINNTTTVKNFSNGVHCLKKCA